MTWPASGTTSDAAIRLPRPTSERLPAESLKAKPTSPESETKSGSAVAKPVSEKAVVPGAIASSNVYVTPPTLSRSPAATVLPPEVERK